MNRCASSATNSSRSVSSAPKTARIRIAKLKAGGKAKYLLPGWLRRAACGSHYIFADGRSYACSSSLNGACQNKLRVCRDVAERIILNPLKDELLSPDRVARMAKELEKRFAERVKAASQKAGDAPRELQELDARLTRLRDQLRCGDPDLTEDELQAAIAKVESKRRELAATANASGAAKVLSLLPKAAESYRQQIVAGLDGHPEAAAKARLVLRDLLGIIQLKPEGDELWAEWQTQPAVLLRNTGTECSSGRGDRI